ncbi:hypothetical protein ELS18_00655 [Clostridium perfringens]|nr:hypothetical protein ELS18_00655 [Clostridium perfringens]
MNLLFSKLNNLLILIFILTCFTKNKFRYFSKHLKIEASFLLFRSKKPLKSLNIIIFLQLHKPIHFSHIRRILM